MKTSLNLLILLFLTSLCFGQNDSVSEKGFYIPRNIQECNQQLDIALVQKAKEKFKDIDELWLKRVYGIYIINEWFDNDSTRLANYFKQFSIDWNEREYLILLSYHRLLNNRAFDFVLECKKITNIKDSLLFLREAEYKKDILSDSIDGVFIPPDIYSCFTQLDKILNDTIKQEIKAKTTEFELIGEYHMGLGRWMRNNWGLWNGSRLQVYFINKKVGHPDNISSVILIAYNKYLNGENINIEKLINEERIREEEFMKNVNSDTIVFDTKEGYSKDYKKFLRTKRIKDFSLSN